MKFLLCHIFFSLYQHVILKQQLQVEMGYASQSPVFRVAYLNSWEEFPEWNSFDLVLTITWTVGFLAGKRA